MVENFYTLDLVFKEISEGGNWRLYIGQYIDDFRRSNGKNSLFVGETHGVDERIVALFAATTHALCRDQNVQIPEWLKEIKPLKYPFFPAEIENLKPMALQHSRPEFKRLNIYVLDNFLDRC